jgi:hypothetical protein
MGRSNIRFTNSTRAKIYVAYMRRDNACGNDCGDPWDVLGWIALDPGETEIRANPTEYKWFYYYAEDANGAMWSGRYVGEVTQARFEKCTCLGVLVQNGEASNPYRDVGFRALDTEAHSGVNFI